MKVRTLVRALLASLRVTRRELRRARERAGIETDALLCLMCASLHLDRAFRLEDFSPAPVNRNLRTVWWFARWPAEPEKDGAT